MSPSGDRRRLVAPLLATAFVAGAFRFAYWRALEGHRELLVPVLDGAASLEWARGLLAGAWPGNEPYFRAPGYVATLAALLGATGGDAKRVAALQLVLGIATPLLTALLAARLFGIRAAWVAGIGAALYPTFLFFDMQLLAPFLAVPTFAAAVLFSLSAVERGGTVRAAGAGVLFGIAAVTWPPLLLAGAGLAVVLARRRPRDAVLATVGLLAAPLLATAHNVAVGDPSFIATQGGLNLYLGNSRTADGMAATFAEAPTALGYRMVEAAARIAEREEGRRLRPSEVSSHWTRRALGEIAADPSRWLGLIAKKTFLVFWQREIPNNQDFALVAQEIPLLRLPGWGWWIPLAIVATWAGRRRRDVVGVAAAGGAVLIGCVLFFVNDRFRVPAAPLVVALGAGGLLAIVDAVRSGARREALALAATALLIGGVVRLNPYRIPERPWVMSYVLVAEAERDRGEPCGPCAGSSGRSPLSPGCTRRASHASSFAKDVRVGDARAWERALAAFPSRALHEPRSSAICPAIRRAPS